jgi:hypothetical protein
MPVLMYTFFRSAPVLFSTSYVKLCHPEPATILLGRPLIVAERFSSRSTDSQSVYGSNESSALADELADEDAEDDEDCDAEPDCEVEGLPVCDWDAVADAVSDEEADASELCDALAEADEEAVLLCDSEEPADGDPVSSANAAGPDSRASGTMAAVAATVTRAGRSFMKTSGIALGEAFRRCGGAGVALVYVRVTGETCE